MSIVRTRARAGRRGGHGIGAFAELGATTVAASPLDLLALQVNRFGPGAPAAYQISPQTFTLPVASLDVDLASTAMLIYQRRAIDSYAQFQDAASSALIQKANAGMADPVTWVSANLADVTSVVKGYGDSVGLPAAAGGTIFDSLSSAGPLGIPMWGWAAAGVVAVGAIYRRSYKRRRR